MSAASTNSLFEKCELVLASCVAPAGSVLRRTVLDAFLRRFIRGRVGVWLASDP